MVEGARCLNLATSVGVVLYEALRQVQFRFPEKRERTKETTALTRTELVSGA
jgi:tRNA C32,U32 (ribose-2'-O)-methylase TrmJ